MPKDLERNSQVLHNSDETILKPNAYLKTENEHKDWYNANQMGKQRGKPQMVLRDEKKSSGTRKHSLRKELPR